MAFFQFRKGADSPATTPPESVEAMRRRARYRLTGAAVLVLAGVIGFPLLFDTQPRPMAVDIPIEIPDRNKVKPLGPPAPAPASGAPVAPAVSAAPSASGPAATALPSGSADRKEPAASGKAEERAEAKADPAGDGKADRKPGSQTQAKTEAKSEKPPSRAEQDAGKARALLDGKPAEAAASAASAPSGEARYVVQVGAFADAAKAQDTRQKVERSGLKTYTHVAETKEGKRTRVRVGPFATRSEADKAAAKIKGLDLPASVLAL